ncbi:C4-dicarboxylate TRAP transporter substrate-binding protein [Kineothrix sp. MB12-C1]|uniref:C4-dicarboxylate TRAP transporter substrate-binding protein n=1 Tax=Kineothrix sp. MB12-C1 TaxID=3070215 RepID=UPI0027D261E4|nr:C4-dicarboxylate TRAP transporter substrate-binding protein [Kineothrix sp. MB12-C1]WMC92124.1 C4-dicarboxylate TRAP transporter substrate-binding protein [Kineothrix sp. MB12-C1]
MKKKILALTLSLTMLAAVMTGCGQSAAGGTTAANEEQKTETEAADMAAEVEVVIQFGHDNNEGDPVQEAAKYWAERLSEVSGGTMKLEVFPSGQLGSKSDLIDQILAGDSVVCIGNGPFLADRGAPDLGIMQAPYLFETWEELDTLVASDWWAEQMTQLEGAGLKVIAGNWRYGVRHTITTKPVTSPEDIKGMKIRTQGSTVHVKGFEVLGAAPTPMPLTEVYTSLSQGTIDGLENPLSVIYSGKFQEVAKNLMLDGHIRDLSQIVISNDFFNSLTEEQQGWLLQTAQEAGERQNELAAIADEESLQKLKDEGVTVTEVDFGAFRTAAEPFYEDTTLTGAWSDGLVDRVKEIIGQ